MARAKKGITPVERALLNTMDPMSRMMILGPEKAMQFEMQRLKRSLRAKVSRAVGYRALVMKVISDKATAQVQTTEGQIQQLLQATGTTSVDQAMAWIAQHQAAQGQA